MNALYSQSAAPVDMAGLPSTFKSGTTGFIPIAAAALRIKTMVDRENYLDDKRETHEFTQEDGARRTAFKM